MHGRLQGCGYLTFRQLDSETVCDRGRLGSPAVMSCLSLSDFALERTPKNRAHFLRTNAGSRSILPSSLQMSSLRTNLRRFFYSQGLQALEESPFIVPARLLLQTLKVLSKAASAESLEKPEKPESCCHPIYSGRQVTPFGYVEDVLHFRANARGSCEPRGQSDNSRLAIFQTLSMPLLSLCCARACVLSQASRPLFIRFIYGFPGCLCVFIYYLSFLVFAFCFCFLHWCRFCLVFLYIALVGASSVDIPRGIMVEARSFNNMNSTSFL